MTEVTTTAKTSIGDLALLGGRPLFESPVLFGRPNIGDRDALRARLDEVLDSGWLSNGGRLVRRFERRVAEIAGTKHAVVTCNATSGLQLALVAAGVTDEVIVPSFTFAATAHAVAWMGLTPVLCDVDPVNGAIDLEQVESLIGPRTRAILGVHIWGMPRDLTALEDIASRHDIRLIFDAAQAFGCEWGGRPIGGFGDAEVFSFHATKFINSFEGGALVTDDDDVAHRAALMRNFGLAQGDQVAAVGINAKMNEACAAMGLTSLDRMDDFVAHNRGVYRRYRDGLLGIDGVTVLPVDETQRRNYQYVVVHVDPDSDGLDRDGLLELLLAENVVARRYFYPGCHQMAPYRTDRAFPGTDRVASTAMVLPTGTGVDAATVDQICALVRFAMGVGADIAAYRRDAVA